MLFHYISNSATGHTTTHVGAGADLAFRSNFTILSQELTNSGLVGSIGFNLTSTLVKVTIFIASKLYLIYPDYSRTRATGYNTETAMHVTTDTLAVTNYGRGHNPGRAKLKTLRTIL